MESKNALAELAEREWSEADKDKARRIVAELAKVHVDEIKEDPFNALGAFAILMSECRAIAEEGAGYGK